MSTSREPVDGLRSTLGRAADAIPEHVDASAATRRDASAPADDASAPVNSTGPNLPSRYVLLDELGRGGMGVVHAAYDTVLDRKVALKLVRDAAGGPESHARLLREARALARLAHPNVVGVYEVGELGQQVFLAMELVEGMNLRAWLTTRTRTRADILAVFLQAAEGLTAAHAAGLVHRDFKPDNVLIGADGRVRVTDFGLARRSLDAPPRDEEVLTRPMDPQVTAAGAILGTPAYMAPEQHLGLSVTAAADVYSFAVALYEALHGQRPYQGASTRELSDRVLRGKRTHTIEAGRVPAWLQAVIDRGMALEPVDRWPTMSGFSAALRRDPTRRRRLLAATAALGLAVATWFAALHHRESTQIAACVADGASIDETWNAAVAAELRAHLHTSDVPYARTTIDRVVPLLTAHAEQWREARTGACLDAAVHHTLDADTHDRTSACLDDDRTQMDALIADLSRPGDRNLELFVPAATGLPPIAECRDVDHLRRAPPLPEDRQALRAARAALSRADIKRQTGLPAEALPAAREAVAAAQQLAWPPLIAEAEFLHGLVLVDMAANAEAEPLLERAYFQAIAAGAPLVAADIAESLANAALPFSRNTDALRWVQHAEALLTALGVPETAPQRLDLLAIRARIVLDDGDYAAALILFERQLAAELAHYGPGHHKLPYTYDNLALTHKRLGHLREARGFYEQSVASAELGFGPDHPAYAVFLTGLADILGKLDEHSEAIALNLRSVAILQAAYGPDHVDAIDANSRLANAYARAGRFDESRALYEQVLVASERLHGRDSFMVGVVLNNFSMLLQRQGRASEGLPLALRALQNFEKEHGPDHPDVGAALNNIAGQELDVADDLHARAHFERALALFEALPAPHPGRPISLRGLAVVASREGRHADAVALAERSVKLHEEGEDHPTKLANARLALAEALVGVGGDLARARALAHDARVAYAAAVGFTREVALADALLARLP